MTLLVVTVACAVVIGVTLGLLGGGGSILAVPLLTYVGQRPPREAIASSLLAVAMTALVAAIVHARAGRVVWKTGASFGLAGMAGAFVGGRAAAVVPERALMVGFGLMMAAAAIAMLRGRRGATTDDDDARAPRPLPLIATQGAAVGGVTGLVGAGGGFIIVPALTVLARLPIHAAVGTSLMVIAMNASAGFLGHLDHAPVEWSLTLGVTAAMVAGSLAGGHLAGRVSPARLRTGFGWFVIAMAVFVLVKQL